MSTRATILSHRAEAYLYNVSMMPPQTLIKRPLSYLLKPCVTRIWVRHIRSALGQAEQKEMAEKLKDAEHSCEKAGVLDSSTAVRCWENIGILLSNDGYMKDAFAPW